MSHSSVTAPDSGAPAVELPPARADTALDLTIRPGTYEWAARLTRLLRRLLRINIKLHDPHGGLEQGDILLFNHFARFETFIPQYLVYEHTGCYSRSIAAPELFADNDALRNFLLRGGAVPSDLPGLLPLLAGEILRGRKVVIFPEGGMVKDRRVHDPEMGFHVYSRMTERRRKHHTGAAWLAWALDAFKLAVERAAVRGEHRRLAHWAATLELEDADALCAAAAKPTRIVPGNITFYPMRVSGNLVQRLAETFGRGMSPRASEELLIESNLLFKDTDMDIRLGPALEPRNEQGPWSRAVIGRLERHIRSLDELFERRRAPQGLWHSVYRRIGGPCTARIRDRYMAAIYDLVTVNLSHVASWAIVELCRRGRRGMDIERFHRAVYLGVKALQRTPGVHLHRSLQSPEAYQGLMEGHSTRFAQFMESAIDLELIRRDGSQYRFLPKLEVELDLDSVRLENPIVVYANEVAPLASVRAAIDRALVHAPDCDARELARLRFDDERRAYSWDRQAFDKPRHRAINQAQRITASGEPYLLLPAKARGLGVVLVHGFLASPAELRRLGERLATAGFAVVGVRLKGHGTSPWDLRERTREDWLASVRRGYRIIEAFVERVALVGFSTGGSLAFALAAEHPAKLAGVVSVSAPMRFANRNMVFVPFLHGASRVMESLSQQEAVMPFRRHHSEHPEINYAHVPIRAVYQLTRLVAEMPEHLAAVDCPVLIAQASRDPVVLPDSVDMIEEHIASTGREKIVIDSDRHGILNEDIDNLQARVLDYLNRLDERARTNRPGRADAQAQAPSSGH